MHGEGDPCTNEVVREPGGVGLFPRQQQGQAFRLGEGGQGRRPLWDFIDGDEDPLAILQLRTQVAQQDL